MSITSLVFLLVFLPASLAIYWMADDKAKEYVLLGISLVFYAAGSLRYLVLFAVACMITVTIARTMDACHNKEMRKLLLIVGILFNAGLLAYYKYTGFALATIGRMLGRPWQARDLLLPMGISFYPFKAI